MALPDELLTRAEEYLNRTATGGGTIPDEPLTRAEMYLNKIATGDGNVPEVPLTRMEQYLDYIAKNGGGGGGGGSSSLPSVTSADNGKTLGVVNGAWSAKNGGFVTPEDFGAIGDGVTDDSDALQNAISSGNVVAPPGKTYLITKPIRFSGYVYDFSGSVIKMADNYAKNNITVDGISQGYIGIAFDNVNGFCVSNLVVDGNKSGNSSVATICAKLSSCSGVFFNCTFQNGNYKNIDIYRNCKVDFYSTTLRNIGTYNASSDVYVSAPVGSASNVLFDGVYATREPGNESTGQAFYIGNGNVTIQNAVCENCHSFTDSRQGITVVRNAVVYDAQEILFVDDSTTRADPADITYENVRFYGLYRHQSNQAFVIQIGGVKSLSLKNVYVDVASASTYTTALQIATTYGKMAKDVHINNLQIALNGGTPTYGIYLSGDDTAKNIYLEDCIFTIPTESANAYAFRIDNVPENVVVKDCVFENFGKKQVYAGKENLIKIANAVPRRVATANLPTLTYLDTGSIVFDTTDSKFKAWNGTAWVEV